MEKQKFVQSLHDASKTTDLSSWGCEVDPFILFALLASVIIILTSDHILCAMEVCKFATYVIFALLYLVYVIWCFSGLKHIHYVISM